MGPGPEALATPCFVFSQRAEPTAETQETCPTCWIVSHPSSWTLKPQEDEKCIDRLSNLMIKEEKKMRGVLHWVTSFNSVVVQELFKEIKIVTVQITFHAVDWQSSKRIRGTLAIMLKILC